MKRRSALKLIAASAVLPSLEACARAFQAGTRWPANRYRITPVHVAPERVIREVVGLRPFRRSGFRVEAEAIGDKTLIHNYGHGGGGMSLSWGSADLAARAALATPHRRAAVIGCGALGLSTARLLQDRGVDVTIYTRDLPPNTTSNIAGAQWTPTTVADTDRRTATWDAQYVAAAHFAYRYFQTLVSPKYGIS